MRRRLAERALGHIGKAEEDLKKLADNGEAEEQEKRKIRRRIDALERKVRVIERRPTK